MSRQAPLGEFEHLLLLAVLQLGPEAVGTRVSEALDLKAARRVSRGALYSSLDRLELKGFLTWTLAPPTPERGGHPARRFQVTESGLAALREHHAVLRRLTAGLEDVLEGGRS